MKTKKKSLQKFTESEKRIQAVLQLEEIQVSDLHQLSDDEGMEVCKRLTEKLNTAKGIEKDKIVKQISPFMQEETKNQLWENNHNQIMYAISSFVEKYGYMPSKTEIAIQTELSRQTIHKHLKEFKNHPLYIEQIEQFRFMTSKVLAKVFQFAINGDVGAAKLYFKLMGNLNNEQNSNNTLIQNQNNYIQINGIILNQDKIKHLNQEQLNTIESVLKTAFPNTKPLDTTNN